jgi:hypothetical protein
VRLIICPLWINNECKSSAIGLIGLAVTTMPYGIIILAGMAWVWSKG